MCRWQPGAILLALLVAAIPVRAEAPVWPWPVPTDPPAVTGTFMESRETRFHTGLDIRTQGTTGWPVLSPVDGWVSRLRCSARGYGLALYIRAQGGQTVVFAHLDRFFDPAAAQLRSAQARTGRYEQDLSFAEGEIPVGRGQVVALSGETGTGAPHVHLEVRDRDQRPLNPADFVGIPDQAAPEVLALRLGAADVDSPVDREIDRSGAAIDARGTWFVEVLALDRTGLSPFPVAPRSITLFVDGRRHYRLSNDAVNFDQSKQMRLDQRNDERGRWYRLTRREGLALAGREGLGTEIEVADRPVELWVVAEDDGGRKAEFSAVLRPERYLPEVDAVRFSVGERLLVVEVPGPSDMPPLLEGPDRHYLLEPTRGGWRLGLEHALLADGRWKLLHRGQLLAERELRFAAGGLDGFETENAPGLLAVGPEEVFPGGALELELVDVPPAPGLVPVGRGLALRSRGLVPARPFRFEPPEGPRTHALLMRFDGRRWKPLDSDGTLGSTDAFGIVAWMGDAEAPRIGDPEGPGAPSSGAWVIRRTGPAGSHGISLPDWPAVSIPVEDLGSGLPDAGPELRLDDRPWPARWDGERGRVVLDGFVPPPVGRHRITVRARDLAGHEAERSWDVEFVR